MSPAGSGEYQRRRKCFSFLVHQEGDALGSGLSRNLKIHLKLSIPTSSTLHCHILSSASSTTCYLILDLCISVPPRCPHELFSLFIFLSHSTSHTFLDFSPSTPSLARSCPCPASALSGNIHSRSYCHPALRNTQHQLHKSVM